MLWWLLACTGADPVEGPSRSVDTAVLSTGEATTPTGTVPGPTGSTGTGTTAVTGDTAPRSTTGLRGTGATADTADTALQVPLVTDALLGRCDPTFQAGNQAPLMHRVTLTGGSRCNDGTPPVLFVRPASDPGEDRWVVHFDGGGRCGSGEECAQRWCGEGFYDATKMSSRWAPLSRGAEGILSDRPENRFAGWNLVLVKYCSSDFWVGDRRNAVLHTDDGTPYRVHFEGARIVDDVVDWLQVGGPSDDGLVSLPAATGASLVLISGSSAGGMGVNQHLDTVAGGVAPAPAVGLIDAMVTPDAGLMGVAGLEQAWVDELDHAYHHEVMALYGGRLHPGCVAAEVAAPQTCWLPTPLQFTYLQTPYFLHHDLRDLSLSDSIRALGAPLDGYAVASQQLLIDLAAARPELGVRGASCRDHTALTHDDRFLRHTVHGQTLHDALWDWLEGGTVHQVHQAQGDSVCR